jgi:hypothetical protein
MSPPISKLVLPTIETCRWRQAEANGDGAQCGLIARMTGAPAGELSAVTNDVCAACCHSFPPTVHRLNPVVASVLYAAATNLVGTGGTAFCTAQRAEHLRELADRSLDITVPERFSITPARASAACCYLGEPIEQSVNGGSSSGEPVHVCRHPAHELTTPSGCWMCRDWTREPPRSRFLALRELVPPPDRRCGPEVKEWAVGVTTAPRRRPTLELCLDSIVRAGWPEPRIFLDGTAPLPPRYGHLPLTWREEAIGAFPAWHLALVELLLQQPKADAYLLLQDDVILYDRECLREYLEAALWPGERPAIISLFYTGLDTRPGWRPMQEGWQWGAQGFVFPPDVARRLAADGDFARSWLAASAERHVAIPEALWRWVLETGTDVWYANPSLTQHIGNTSTIWMDSACASGRRAPWFAGSIETKFAAQESTADFPEDEFACPDELQGTYRDRVERGRRKMRERTAVICGLCRDVRHYLPRMAARIERLGGMFRDYRVVLVENDSVDATSEFLLDWAAINPRVEAITESIGVPRFPQTRDPQRAEWLAHCRNRCRAEALARYGDFSDVIVLDMDLAGGFSFDGLAHTFGEEDWDFVGSYGVAQRLDRRIRELSLTHVDVWAFRPLAGSPPTKLRHYNDLALARGEPLLAVESCFGGLGVYRMACYAAAEYGGGDCEHVVLHERMRRAGFGRQFLNPSQIVLYTPF